MPHSTAGSSIYTVKELCDRALRKIGAFSIRDDAADQDDLKEMMYWADMLVAHNAGKQRAFWLVADVEITLAEDDADYVLAEELNATLPQGVQFPIAAMLEDDSGNRTPLSIVRNKEFRELSLPTTEGRPEIIWIDRLNGPTLHVYPVPGETEDGFTIILTVQSFSPTVRPRNVNRDTALTNQKTDLRATWNLWFVTALAAEAGDGPVRMLPDQTIARWRSDALRLETELKAYENREHDDDPPIIKASAYL